MCVYRYVCALYNVCIYVYIYTVSIQMCVRVYIYSECICVYVYIMSVYICI